MPHNLWNQFYKKRLACKRLQNPAQVIESHPDQTIPETELLAAARGKIRGHLGASL